MPFNFVFQGSFFDMEHFLSNVNHFIDVQGKNVRVTGRLLSVDGLSLTAGPKGFPQVKADLTSTAYLLPADEGLTNGATPNGPATVPASTTTSSGATSTPTATATGVHP